MEKVFIDAALVKKQSKNSGYTVSVPPTRRGNKWSYFFVPDDRVHVCKHNSTAIVQIADAEKVSVFNGSNWVFTQISGEELSKRLALFKYHKVVSEEENQLDGLFNNASTTQLVMTIWDGDYVLGYSIYEINPDTRSCTLSQRGRGQWGYSQPQHCDGLYQHVANCISAVSHIWDVKDHPFVVNRA